MTKAIVFLFSMIFPLHAFADRKYDLPLEQWSDDDSSQVFAVLDEELNNEEYREYEEVYFDEQEQIMGTKGDNDQPDRYGTDRSKAYSSRIPFSDVSYNNNRLHYNSSHRYRNSHRRGGHRRHRRDLPVVVPPPPIIVVPPPVSNICRSGPLGNGFYFCYFTDGLPRIVGSTCSCYLRNAYTGARMFFRGRVSTW